MQKRYCIELTQYLFETYFFIKEKNVTAILVLWRIRNENRVVLLQFFSDFLCTIWMSQGW